MGFPHGKYGRTTRTPIRRHLEAPRELRDSLPSATSTHRERPYVPCAGEDAVAGTARGVEVRDEGGRHYRHGEGRRAVMTSGRRLPTPTLVASNRRPRSSYHGDCPRTPWTRGFAA